MRELQTSKNSPVFWPTLYIYSDSVKTCFISVDTMVCIVNELW